MKIAETLSLSGLLLTASHSFAGTPAPAVGLSIEALPLDTGGLAAIAAVSLIIGAQAIKRRK